MKKLLLVGVLAVFMLGVVACGGGADPESLAKDMIKFTDNYTAALKKVASKEDLLAAMKTYSTAMAGISEKGKALMEKNPEAMKKMENKELEKKIQESMMSMMAAFRDKNVMKYLSDPDVQKASKAMSEAMMKK